MTQRPFLSWARRPTASCAPIFLLVAATLTWAADDFLPLMRKAEGRKEPEERVLYFTRAIAAWTPAHGNGLLANCLFRRGEASYEAYDFAGALPDLGQALDFDPRNARAYFLRGMIRLHQARSEKTGAANLSRLASQAARDLAEYAALNPGDCEGLLALGQAQVLAGRSGEALGTFTSAQRLIPSDPRPRLGAGRAFMAARDLDRAQASLDEADALARGRDAEVLTERAVCRAARGDETGALADYDRALPRHEDVIADMVRSRAHPADIAERRAAAGRAYYGRGRIRESRGDKAGARDDYQAGCRHGHEPCCRRARALAAAKGPPPLRVAPPRKPKPRKKIPNPKSSPGDRIYAH